MAKKKKLPDDVRRECLSIVSGYNRRVREYYDKRLEILHGTPTRFIEIGDQMDKNSMWAYMPSSHTASRTAENTALALEALENSPETKKIRAVDSAKKTIGMDLSDPELKKRLEEAIVLNCISGRRFPYTCFDLTGIEQTNFYDRRTEFLIRIAKDLGIM